MIPKVKLVHSAHVGCEFRQRVSTAAAPRAVHQEGGMEGDGNVISAACLLLVASSEIGMESLADWAAGERAVGPGQL